MDASKAVELFQTARDNGVSLSPRSLDFMVLDNDDDRVAYMNEFKDVPINSQSTVITCMDLIKKDSENADAITLLIVGTESGCIYFLPPDPSDSNIICSVKLPSTPVLLSVNGMFDIEWRVVVACRDGKLYSIKNGEVRGQAVLTGNAIENGSLAVAIARQDKHIVVSTMDKQLALYSVRGKRISGSILHDIVTEICVVQSRRSSGVTCLLVALQSGEIRLYKGTILIHSFTGKTLNYYILYNLLNYSNATYMNTLRANTVYCIYSG
jgi:Bardet-Biedl syndrome 1 protein